ncbi:helicase in vascular tissue and tapetum [Actinidia rufa]|uniref:Helicase in vascular tissue and tapetum n=1 Tax=Actinidia rufa TaxID=165716 RepID=A0A7J0GIA5_9ERIC|nr:helicase in vascular tissue and tapetum [Actinidia rufa]
MTPTAPSSSAKKKQKNGKGPKPTDGKGPKVTEAYRIRINEILERFRTSEDDVYTFEADLSNQERRFVHETCRKMGMKSKSSGHGNQRRLSLYKNKKKVDTTKEKENLTSFTFSEEARGVLQNLFTQYPPDDQDLGDEIVAKHRRRTENLRYNRDDIFNRPLMCQGEIAKKMGSLASRVEKSPDLRQITEERAKLPIASFRDVITSTVESNQVVLISGETGCGKTTQVPQFLLDDRWGKRESCKIVCTQPRRISATSGVCQFFAERISCERGENIGESVGYKIRLESKGGRHSSIVFCTNGVLLRVLVSKGTGRLKAVSPKTPPRDDVSDITHIIVDEIHERDRNSDFMLAILRDMLPSYPELRLVLMSATLDAERFSQYFGGSPIIRVPGFTYPVKAFYLEDVLSILKGAESNHLDCTSEATTAEQFELTEEYRIALDEAINLAWSNDEFESLLDLVSSEGTPKIFNYQHSLSGITPLMVFAGKGRVGDVCMLLSFGAHCHLRANDGTTALELAERENQEEAADIIRNHMEKVPSNSEEEKELLNKYLSTSNPELVDVVLIEQLLRKICMDSTDGAILVFLPGGRMKEKSYDPYDNVSTLQTSWVSKASAKQREGRAGRCQPGICYHLYSKLRAASLADFQVPEIKRTPIEELCLQAKLLEPNCKIEDFLSKTLDPPVFETIRNAMIVLQDIGALSVDGELTDLGEKLGALPVHPLISKMLLFAILLKCLDPALTLACAANYRDPFTLPMLPNEKKRAAAAKSELALLSGGNSDQLAVIAAFECWKNAKNKGQEKQFCSEYFVSSGTMSMLSRMRKQLQNELLRHGFIPEDVSSCNLNAHDPGILRAILVSGLYPMVARLRPPLRNTRRFVETAGGDKVRLHPHSSNFKLSFMKSSDRPLIVYDEITRGDGGMHIRNCSVTGPLPLLLWATEIVVAPVNDTDDGDDDESDYEDTDEDQIDEDKTEMQNKSGAQSGNKIMSSPDNAVKIVVDRWLSFESTALDVAQIYCLRERLSSAILSKVICPRKVLPPFLGASMHAIACVLSYDGLSGVSLQSEPVDAVTSIVNATEINQSTPRGTEMMGQDSNRFLKSLMYSHTRRNTPSNLPTNIPPPYVLTTNSNGLPFVNSGGALRGSGIVGPLAPMGDSTKRQRGN